MLRLVSVLIVSALLALPSGVVAAADSTSPAAPGKLYLDLDVGARRIDTADFNFYSTASGSGVATGKMRTRAVGVGADGAIGYVFNKGSFPAAFGENTRVELVLGFAAAKRSRSTGLAAGNSYPRITGGVSVAFGAPVNLEFDAKSKLYDIGVRLRTDYPLAGSALTFSPYFGMGFEYMSHNVRNSTSDNASLVTDLRTHTGYLKAGATVNLRAAPETTVFLSPSITVTRAHSSLDARQFIPFVGAAILRDGNSFWAARMGGKVGLFTHISMVRIGVEGGLEYWTDIPYVAHESVNIGAAIVPSHIRRQGALNASASFRITIPLD